MARQLLMDGIDEEMQPIDIAGAGKDTPLEELKAHASRISTMFPAFPHLFPPQTKPGTSADAAAIPTTATAAVWEKFDDFYKLSQAPRRPPMMRARRRTSSHSRNRRRNSARSATAVMRST
jgi:Cytochrome C'